MKASRIDNEYISKLLLKNKSRFKCGSETGKKNSFWGLRKMCAPPLPSKYFPSGWGRWALPTIKPDPAENRFDPRSKPKHIGFPKSGRLSKRIPNSIHFRNKHRSRFKDSDNDSDTLSKVALDVLIKPPKDFAGLNNPFRMDVNGGTLSKCSVSRGGELTPNSSLRNMPFSEKSSPVSSGATSTVTTDGKFL